MKDLDNTLDIKAMLNNHTNSGVQRSSSGQSKQGGSPDFNEFPAEESDTPTFEQKDHLVTHREKYEDYKQKYHHEDVINANNKWDYNTIVKELQETPIKCCKYNYTLDAEI